MSNELAPIHIAYKSPTYMRLVSLFLLAYLFNLRPFISSTHITFRHNGHCFIYLFIYFKFGCKIVPS